MVQGLGLRVTPLHRMAGTWAMLSSPHDRHTPLPMPAKATTWSLPQSSHQTRAKPWAKMPQARFRSARARHGSLGVAGV